MTTCPEIELLLSAEGQTNARAHLATCDACAALVALAEVRSERELGRDDPCIDAEVRIALWHAELLGQDEESELISHLEHCAECNELAVRMRALPRVTETSASAATLTDWVPMHVQRRRRIDWRVWVAAAALISLVVVAFSVQLVRRPRTAATPAPTPSEIVALPAAPAPTAATVPEEPSAPSVGAIRRVEPRPVQPAPYYPDPVDPFRATEPARVGYLTVMCVPICDAVYVDGKNTGPSPLVRLTLPAGNHSIKLVRGSTRKMLSVTVVKGQTTARRIDMSDRSGDPGY